MAPIGSHLLVRVQIPLTPHSIYFGLILHLSNNYEFGKGNSAGIKLCPLGKRKQVASRKLWNVKPNNCLLSKPAPLIFRHTILVIFKQ